MNTTDWRDAQRSHLFFTWSRQASTRGLEIDEAHGARFHVPDKGWVWDLESQVYNVNIGHNHPHVKQRMIQQIDSMPAAGPHVLLPIRAELGRELASCTGMPRAFLTTGGSEAVENAVKIARLFTGRQKIVARRNSYHGATLAMLGIAGDPRRDPFAPGLPPAFHIDDPYPVTSTPDGTSTWLANFHALLEREGPDSIAAVLLEGLSGTNGVQIPPDDFWPGVRKACDRYGILLIDDEIFSGFGRTGKWFAREHWNVQPDMMVIGKGLTSGYAPLAGVMVNQTIADHFADQTLWCGLTHYAHPVSCAAAMGAIEVLRNEGLVDHAHRVGAQLHTRLESMRSDAVVGTHVVDVRGRGLQLALQFDRHCAELVQQLWSRNIYAPFRGDTLFVCPPLCLAADDADTVADELLAAAQDWLR